MKKKNIWGIMLSLVVTIAVLTVFGGIAVSADASVVESGNCGANGDNVTYTLYSDGLLEITGTGEMCDYSYSGAAPWHDYYESITEVSFSSGITHIASNCCNYYKNLRTAYIPDTVTSIGQYAFYYCIELTTADLSDNIVRVDNYAFYYCEKLDIPNFPHNIQYIGEAAFQKCLDLTELTIPDSVETIGNRAFYMCSNLETLNFPTGANLKFDTIPSGCFSDCEKLTTITIPSGVTSIGDSAFNCCYELSSISIPASVTSIGNYTFSSCYALETIDLPNTITSIGRQAFYHTGLTTVTIPNSITEIAEGTFYYCDALETVNIPDSVTTIGDNAFEQCLRLESIDLPAGLTSLGQEAFRECRALKSIVIPNGITSVNACTFTYCVNLSSVTLPDNLENIGDSAFYGCHKLTSIDLPDSLKTIGISAFAINFTEEPAGLESLVLPEGVTFKSDPYSGARTFENTNITSLTIPGSITTIPENTFWYSRKLQSVTFGEGVEVIEFGALRYSNNIKTVVIPSTVTKIGMYALGSGDNMTDVYCYANPDNLDMSYGNKNNFNSNTRFHVPARYLDIYKENFPGLADNFIGDADGEINIGGSTHLCGYTLSMDGNIGVNFYMTLGDDILNNASTAYMQFTVNGKTQKVKVSDAKRDGVYYVFRCDTVAKEMTDTISARMFISEGNPDGDAYTYSVRDYAVYILNHQSGFGAETVAVVKAMLNYGASAQKYFGYKTDDLANSVLADSDRKITYVDPASMSYTSSEKVVNADIQLEQVSLSLKSEITMKLYFSGDTTGVNFYNGNTKLKTSKSGSYTVVTISGIYAQNIGTGITVDAYSGNTYLGSATCAPMRYCQLALTLNDAAVTPELKEVVSALYYYSQALIQYAG